MALTQATVILPKLARDLKLAAEASKSIAELAGQDPKAAIAKATNSVLDEFTARRAVVKNGGGNLITELTDGGHAAGLVAEGLVALKGDLKVLDQQIQGDIGRVQGTEEQKKQASIDAIRSVLDQVNQAQATAKAANQDFTIQKQAAITRRDASLKERTDAISSVKMLNKTVAKVAQETNASAEATYGQTSVSSTGSS